MRRESIYQAELVKKLQDIFPDCFILKNDPSANQGIPDLLILIGSSWAMLEVKRSASEPFRPNQEYYLEAFGAMSYASVIYPENEEQVLNDLQSTFRAAR